VMPDISNLICWWWQTKWFSGCGHYDGNGEQFTEDILQPLFSLKTTTKSKQQQV